MKAFIPSNSPYDPLPSEAAQKRLDAAYGALLERDLLRNPEDEGFPEFIEDEE